MRKTAGLIYRDGYSLGQLAQQWGRSTYFVQDLVRQGVLQPDDRGVITTAELHRFQQHHGDLLNA